MEPTVGTGMTRLTESLSETPAICDFLLSLSVAGSGEQKLSVDAYEFSGRNKAYHEYFLIINAIYTSRNWNTGVEYILPTIFVLQDSL